MGWQLYLLKEAEIFWQISGPASAARASKTACKSECFFVTGEAYVQKRTTDSPDRASAFRTALWCAASDDLTQAGFAEGMATSQYPGAAFACIVVLHASAATEWLQRHDWRGFGRFSMSQISLEGMCVSFRFPIATQRASSQGSHTPCAASERALPDNRTAHCQEQNTRCAAAPSSPWEPLPHKT